MSVKIRRMRRSDAVAVAKMMKKLSAHHGDKSLSEAKDFITHCLGPNKTCKTWVAFVDGKPAGFALSHDIVDFIRNIIIRELNLLHVDEAHRRKGIGEALVAAVAKDAHSKGCSLVYVKAIAGNREANRFYRSIGMKLESRGDKRRMIKYIAAKELMRRIAKRK